MAGVICILKKKEYIFSIKISFSLIFSIEDFNHYTKILKAIVFLTLKILEIKIHKNIYLFFLKLLFFFNYKFSFNFRCLYNIKMNINLVFLRF